MLEENKYVGNLLIGFTKAFDSVDHLIMIVKLKNLDIADNIIQRVVPFLTHKINLLNYVKSGRSRR